MSLLQPNQAYRIGVKFTPPLTTIGQLRQLCAALNTPTTALVGLTQYTASVIAVFPSERDAARINYGLRWFKVSNGGKAPISYATIETIRPEVNVTP